MQRDKTQGRKLITHLKRRRMTYMEMLALGISVCPWKRVEEALKDHEAVVKKTNARGLVTWKVIAATRWTA